jgi:hypothetical protein
MTAAGIESAWLMPGIKDADHGSRQVRRPTKAGRPGLVKDVAAGTRRIYRLNPVALAALRDQLDTYWQRALAGYAQAAEAPDEQGR